MSQAGANNTSSGPSPPAVPTQFTADDATIAVPVANNLNVFARDTTEDNPNGIQTTADPNGSANLYVELTNRLVGDGATTGGIFASLDLVTFDLGAIPATYFFSFDVVAFNAATGAGTGRVIYTTFRTNGAAATVIGDSDSIAHTDFSFSLSSVFMTTSGNNAILRVEGLLPISANWHAVGYYVRVQ